MKIYIGHSTDFDYEENLYRLLKESSLVDRHEIVFPHDTGEFFDSEKFLQDECELFIAEVSKASTGLGIELGWADRFDVPVLCICKADADPSSSLEAVTDELKRYENRSELVEVVEKTVER